MLPLLIPPRGRTRAAGKQWKPSIKECWDGLFLHVKSPVDIENVEDEKIDFMYHRGVTVQPYIIIVAPSLSKVTVYIVINNVYKSISVLDASDFCSKSYHILDAKYSFETHHTWYLFQWLLVKLCGKYFKSYNLVFQPFKNIHLFLNFFNVDS